MLEYLNVKAIPVVDIKLHHWAMFFIVRQQQGYEIIMKCLQSHFDIMIEYEDTDLKKQM